MIQDERDTYFRWLENPEFVRTQLTAAFDTEARQERWGKLVFAGRNTRRGADSR